MTTLNDFVFLAATCRLATTQIVVFPLPHCVYECVTMLRYTYITHTFWN